MRGTPVITQLFLTYFALPVALMELTGINITRVPGMFFVTLTYSVYFGASVAENLRGSMNAVGRGQFEAAYSLGMTEFTAFRRIIFPQMIVVALPNFSNIFIRELKNTSLAFSVGVIEMVSAARNLGSVYMHNFEAYAAIAIIYYVLYIMVLQIFNFIEKKVKAHILV
jgi:L-cystine transport system permease protein